MENNFEKRKKEFDPGEDFIKNGGKILEFYPDSRPKHWLCGRGANGEPIHPQGMEKECIRSLNKDGDYEGCNPDEQAIQERALWRSDMMSVDEEPEKKEKKGPR